MISSDDLNPDRLTNQLNQMFIFDDKIYEETQQLEQTFQHKLPDDFIFVRSYYQYFVQCRKMHE